MITILVLLDTVLKKKYGNPSYKVPLLLITLFIHKKLDLIVKKRLT